MEKKGWMVMAIIIIVALAAVLVYTFAGGAETFILRSSTTSTPTSPSSVGKATPTPTPTPTGTSAGPLETNSSLTEFVGQVPQPSGDVYIQVNCTRSCTMSADGSTHCDIDCPAP